MGRFPASIRRLLVGRVVVASGVAAAALILFAPRDTRAVETIEDDERLGEWEEKGMRFGDIVIDGKLERTANGWVLVRTYENTSDEARRCEVEERLSTTQVAQGSRVEPAPVSLIVRNQVLALGPHEKRRIGVPIPASIGAQMDASAKTQAQIDAAMVRVMNGHNPDAYTSILGTTYARFDVKYFKPLPPGAVAARPHGTGMMPPPMRPVATSPDKVADLSDMF